MTSNRPFATRPEFSPTSLIRALWKNKWLSAVTALVLGLAAALIVRRLPPAYRSEALILVESPKVADNFVGTVVHSAVEDRLETMRREILSASHVPQLVKEFKLYPEIDKAPVDSLVALMRKDTEVTLDRSWSNQRTGSFRVSFKGPHPKTVSDVANRIAVLFVEENTRLRNGQAAGATVFFESELKEAKRNLDTLESAMSQYKIRHSGELPQQETNIVGTLSGLQMELQRNQDVIAKDEENKVMLQNELRAAETEEALLERALQRKAGVAVAAPVTERHSAAAAAPAPAKKSAAMSAELEFLRARYSDDHPDVKRLRAQLERQREVENQQAAQEQQQAALQAKDPDPKPAQSGPAPEEAPNPGFQIELVRAKERTTQIRHQITSLDKEINGRHAEHDRIVAEIRSYQSRVENMPVREQELLALTRDYDISKANYTALLGKKISAQMATDLEKRQWAEKFTLLETAKVPTAPFKPNRPLYFGIACAAAVVIGLAVAILKEWKRNVLLGEWELLGTIPILGRVPRIHATGVQLFGEGPRLGQIATVSTLLVLLAAIAAGFFLSSHVF